MTKVNEQDPTQIDIDFKLKFPTRRVRDIEAHFTFEGKEVDINSIPDKSITWGQWQTVRANSKGFALLYPKLDSDALVKHVENTMNNGTKHPENWVPLLVKRIQDLEEELADRKIDKQELIPSKLKDEILQHCDTGITLNEDGYHTGVCEINISLFRRIIAVVTKVKEQDPNYLNNIIKKMDEAILASEGAFQHGLIIARNIVRAETRL